MGAAPRFLDFLFGDGGFRLARGRRVGVLASGEGHASIDVMFCDNLVDSTFIMSTFKILPKVLII